VSALALPRGRRLPLDRGPLVMGIVNVTPDSFYPSSRRSGPGAAAEAALAMEAEGAAIVDVGGESTRPGSEAVGEDEELERVVPAIEAIRSRSSVPISVDTRNAVVASAALAAGADIVNDVSALGHDPAMARVVAESGAAVVLMHMRGEPKTMQSAPYYADCASEVASFLELAARRAQAAGVAPGAIVLDPGIGFGKRPEDNLDLIARLDLVARLGFPVLVGLSRKAFVGAITGRGVEARLAGSLGAACAAYQAGARIFRVHDVAATVDALAAFASSSATAATVASATAATVASATAVTVASATAVTVASATAVTVARGLA
jgi:dihydropteroate synthase